jgi:hypothetical protein
VSVDDKLQTIIETMEEVHMTQRSYLEKEHVLKIRQWLAPPDPTSNYIEALKKRQPTTGTWFIESTEYSIWKRNPGSFLWLHGIRK